MKRKDDDIVVHRHANLQNILFTKQKHKKLPQKRSFMQTVFQGVKTVFSFAANVVTAPVYAVSFLLKKLPKKSGPRQKPAHAAPISAKNAADAVPAVSLEKDPVKASPPPKPEPTAKPVVEKPSFSVQDKTDFSRMTTKADHGYKGGFWQWPVIVTIAVCFCICVASIIFIPPAFAVKKLTVTINDSGMKVTAVSTEKTVGSLLKDFNITIGKHDALEADPNAMITGDMEIVIRRAMPLTVSTAKGDQDVYIVAGTVQDALNKASIKVDKNDEIYPSPNTFVRPGMTIDVVTVDYKYTTESEKIGFKELSRKNAALKKGREVTVQQGSQGVRNIKYKITYKNGEAVSKAAVSSDIVKQPINEIVEIGTRTAVLMEDVPRTSEIYSDTLYAHRRVLRPAPEIIDKVVYADYVTAYTHTGHHTATGTYPRIGTVAVDPRKIPYGTKLYIPGYGYGRAEDTGGFRGKSFLQLDLFMNTASDCLSWGRKREYKIYILK